jgi:ankyrin repeat protein
MVAACYRHLDICRLLIDKGAQIEAKDSDGWTSLHITANNGHIKTARLLCDRVADVEACCSSKWSGSWPLHLATRYGHIAIVKVLIEVRNTDINARNDYGWTALRIAREYEKADMVAYLISKGRIE